MSLPKNRKLNRAERRSLIRVEEKNREHLKRERDRMRREEQEEFLAMNPFQKTKMFWKQLPKPGRRVILFTMPVFIPFFIVNLIIYVTKVDISWTLAQKLSTFFLKVPNRPKKNEVQG